jgi:hypothetical protein
MRRFLFCAGVLALAATPAAALRIAMPNLTTAQKAIQADAVVVGKVTEIEKEEVEVAPFQGAPDKVKMKVAVIKLEDGLIGAKNVTHVKVLMPGSAAEQPVIDQPGPAVRPLPGRIPPGRGGFGPVTLKEGDEGLFFLAKHPTNATYYVINAGNQPVAAKDENYKAELGKVKATVSTLADPMKALKADKAEDRLSAAATLVQKYRRGLSVPSKEEAIPADESKAILKIIADADWAAANKPQQPGVQIDYQAQPANLASMLGLFPGSPNGPARIAIKPGENYAVKQAESFKEWYAKSGDKFEIKRYVPKDK